MKVYSDTLTETDLRAALPAGVDAEIQRIRKARVAKHGYTVSLLKYGGTRWKNSGTNGAGSEKAASYDDHGVWMHRLFEMDPNARVSWWKNREDFERGTEGKFS